MKQQLLLLWLNIFSLQKKIKGLQKKIVIFFGLWNLLMLVLLII